MNEKIRERTEAEAAARPIIPGGVISEFIEGVAESIGVKLLQKMGWRQGKGIGEAFKSATEDKVELDWGPDASLAQEGTQVWKQKPKMNVYGLGFDPFRGSHDFQKAKVQTHEKTPSKRSRGIAFGVGILEETDTFGEMADYVDNSLNHERINYYEMSDDSDDNAVSNAPQMKLICHKTDSMSHGEDSMIAGFHLSTVLKQQRVFPLPVVPPGFTGRVQGLEGSDKHSGDKAAKLPVPAAEIPINPEQKKLIDSVAVFVAKGGHLSEELVRTKHKEDENYLFLFGGKDSEYYRWKLLDVKVTFQKLGVECVGQREAPLTADDRGFLLGDDRLEEVTEKGTSSKTASQLDIRGVPEADRSRVKLKLSSTFVRGSQETNPKDSVQQKNEISDVKKTQSKLDNLVPVRLFLDWHPTPLVYKRFKIQDPFKGQIQETEPQSKFMSYEAQLDEVKDEDVGVNKLTGSVADDVDITLPPPEYTEPPLDIFKSIFDASDQEDQEVVDEEVDKAPELNKNMTSLETKETIKEPVPKKEPPVRKKLKILSDESSEEEIKTTRNRGRSPNSLEKESDAESIDEAIFSGLSTSEFKKLLKTLKKGHKRKSKSKFLYNEKPTAFWNYVVMWSGPSSEECLPLLTHLASENLSPARRRYLGISLALHLYSPRVEMRRQLALASLNNTQSYCCWAEIETEDFEKRIFTNSEDLRSFLQKNQSWSETLEVFSFDYSYHSKTGPVLVVYGGIGTHCFDKFHQTVVKAIGQGMEFHYVFRPVFHPEACGSEEHHPCADYKAGQDLPLGGYGIELALKNTEYKAVDEKVDEASDSPDQDNLSSNKEEASEAEAASIKELKLSAISLQASYLILESEDDSLTTMTNLVQDFPSLVSILSKMKIHQEFRNKFNSISRRLPSNRPFALLNGLPFDVTEFDFYEFLDRLNGEISARDQLRKLKVPQETISKLLRIRSEDKIQELDSVRYNILPSDKDQILYFNNVEKDSAYKSYFKSLEILFNPFASKVALVPIRRNLFNAVFYVQLDSPIGFEVAQTIQKLMEAKAPIRFGVIPVFPKQKIQSSRNEKITTQFLTLHFALGSKAALNYWVSSEAESTNLDTLFKSIWNKFQNNGNQLKEDEVLQESNEISVKVQDYIRFIKELLGSTGMAHLGSDDDGMLWLNGELMKLELNSVEKMVLFYVKMETSYVQRLVYIGALSDEAPDLLEAILDNELSFQKYSPYILGDKATTKEVILTEKDFNQVVFWSSKTEASVTHWIVGNLTSPTGLCLTKAVFEFLKLSDGIHSQFALLADNQCSTFAKLIMLTRSQNGSGIQTGVAEFWIELLSDPDSTTELLDSPYVQISKSFLSRISALCDKHKVLVENLEQSFRSPCENVDLLDSVFEGVELLKGGISVVSNGRMVSFGSDEVDLSVNDLSILQTIALEYQLGSDLAKLLSQYFTGEELSKTVAIVASILRKHSISESSIDTGALQELFDSFDDSISFHSVPKESSDIEAMFELQLVLDPLSSESQRILPILQFLSKTLPADIKIYLNPQTVTDTLPLNNYYTIALPQIHFTSEGHLKSLSPPKTSFTNIPDTKLLTMNPEIPESWLIEPIKAELDLDNIKLEDLGKSTTLEVEYRLESILLTGSCLDRAASTRKDAYPRGVQLTLGQRENSHEVDTLVMSNLGYFQLKANPGRWHLSLAQGRSRELYFIDHRMKLDSSLKLGPGLEPWSLNLLLDSFRGRHMRLRIMKKKGFEEEDVLDDPAVIKRKSSGVIKTLKSWIPFGNKLGTEADNNWKDCSYRDDPVHIFTIASGHMYERLQKIMILSVLKNTNSCVKFWFIKNYMSPQIKNFLPHFARKYNFNYGLITYKWPTWLQKQTEKQRIIWAYKILFLDVLFPLHVPKVIFLDSDQIIRTDIRELYDLDIHGAPLAYTPFCDNNKEMDGFRFWKGGFWKGHLKGKPYHISALYVVDLVKFRQTAAGDRLRVVYDNLSQDPNSLSNLDQDLPNYAQHFVPIYSLSQEWLWCESWCGNATKAMAKTIDLCNNPMTKEPKLQAARRIVAEWSDLDAEARSVTQQYNEKQNCPVEQSTLTHDASEL
eukprot:g643.t1